MTKAELKALQTYPDDKPESWGDVSISHKNERLAYQRGYYQAVEDAIEFLKNNIKADMNIIALHKLITEDFKEAMT